MAVADTVVSIMLLVSIYTLLAIGMNIKYGHTGLLDFGHVAFYLVGAYTAALLVIPPDEPGDYTEYVFGLDLPAVIGAIVPFGELLGWLLAMVVAMVVAGVLGGLVAMPTIRLRADYLAITLLGVSVILQRIVQAESWLVNGPDALRGYSQPLKSLFPLVAGTVAAAIVFGLLVFVVWLATAYLLGRLVGSTTGTGTGNPSASTAERLHAAVTLGLARESDGERPGRRRAVSAAAGAAAVGLVGLVATFVAPLGMLVVGIAVSAFTWALVLVAARRYTGAFDRSDYLASLGLGVAILAALTPVAIVGGVVGGAVTLVAVGVVAYAIAYLSRNWEPFAAKRLRFGAAIAVWFVAVWYFLLPIREPLLQGNLVAVALTLFRNLVWVMSFSGVTPTIDYPRFMLVLFGVITFAGYYVLELSVRSPFGRVLRAIRNDEQVVTSLGKDPFNYKLQSMVLGSALAGLAGAMAALFFQALVFTQFGPRVTFIALLMVFLGGIGNNRAMVVGALAFWAFQSATTQLADFFPPGQRERIQALRLVVLGLVFLFILYYRPQGLFGRQQLAEVETE